MEDQAGSFAASKLKNSGKSRAAGAARLVMSNSSSPHRKIGVVLGPQSLPEAQSELIRITEVR